MKFTIVNPFEFYDQFEPMGSSERAVMGNLKTGNYETYHETDTLTKCVMVDYGSGSVFFDVVSENDKETKIKFTSTAG